MIPGVTRYVTLNASHHKEQQYIGLGVGQGGHTFLAIKFPDFSLIFP